MAGEEKRKQELNQELKRITEVLKIKYRPEKIILYGSFAHGKIHEWSDLDLVVVKKTNKRFYDRIGEVSSLYDHREAVDFLVYTPEEFTDMARWNYFIRDEVVKKGKILYSKKSFAYSKKSFAYSKKSFAYLKKSFAYDRQA